MNDCTECTFGTLVELFESSTAQFADRELFGTKKAGGWQWTSYGEFAQITRRFQKVLAANDIGKGDRVALISGNGLAWAISAYAIFLQGAVLVPLYETQMPEDWRFIIEDCGAKGVLAADGSIRNQIDDMDISGLDCLFSLKELLLGSSLEALGDNNLSAPPKEAAAIAPDDLACLIYTSGTTGRPKGVQLTHGNIASNVSAVRGLYPIGPEDRCLSFLPWAHSFGQTCELHTFISYGASIGICEGIDKIVDNLSEVRPTVLCAVPRIFNRIYGGVIRQMKDKPGIIRKLFSLGLAAAEKQNSGKAANWTERASRKLADKLIFSKIRAKFGGRLKYAISGGAALAPEVARFIDSLGIDVYEGYGLTETSPIVCCNYPGNRKIGSVGKTIPGVLVVIDRSVNRDNADGPTDEGEIVVFGPNVMSGYYNRPEEDEQVFCDVLSGFHTGDLGRIDDDGYLHITGRLKEQYKLENGKYVVPAPLEEALKLSPLIANAMVFGDNQPFNVALVVPEREELIRQAEASGLDVTSPGWTDDPLIRTIIQAEIDRCSSGFRKYERISQVALVEEGFTQENGLLTPTLKLIRRRVVKKYQELIDSLYL